MDGIKPKFSADESLLQKNVEELRQKAARPDQLKESSEDFEALLVQFMLKYMRRTVIKSDLMGSGYGGEIMESLFDQQLSRAVAGNSQLGVAELLQNNLEGNGIEDENAFPLKHLPLRRPVAPPDKVISYFNEAVKKKLAPYNRHVVRAARDNDVDADLIRAVILTESDGNASAVSAKNARGLMQLMDTTAVEVGVKDPFDPAQNISGGARYLRKMLDRFQEDPKMAVAAYNAGPGAVEKYEGIPPYKETQIYVKRVMQIYSRFKER
ncbi:MAG: transglycosylase SLT domain-containing protein [Calditrichia bacterium]